MISAGYCYICKNQISETIPCCTLLVQLIPCYVPKSCKTNNFSTTKVLRDLCRYLIKAHAKYSKFTGRNISDFSINKISYFQTPQIEALPCEKNSCLITCLDT